MSDGELLRRYIRSGSDRAFAELTGKYQTICLTSRRKNEGGPSIVDGPPCSCFGAIFAVETRDIIIIKSDHNIFIKPRGILADFRWDSL